MDCSMPDFPVLHYLLELAQIHVHWSWWCHPTISSCVTPFSFCPQSSPASGSFAVSRLFMSGGQSIGISASASVLPMSICCTVGRKILLSQFFSDFFIKYANNLRGILDLWNSLPQWFRRYGPWTGCISITWEHMRNTNSSAPSQIYWIRNSGGGVQETVLTNPLGDSDAS